MSKDRKPRLPSRILVVGYSNYRVPVGKGERHYEERLAAAVGISIRREGGKVRSERETVCLSIAELNRLILANCDPRSVLYVFAHGLGILLSVGGIWEYMRDGIYSLGRTAAASANAGDTAARPEKQWSGSLITADPPTYLRARSARGVVEFCDLQNYLRMPLGEIARGFSIPEQLNSCRGADIHEHTNCARIDAGSVAAAVLAIIDRWERGRYGPWRPTAAGLAWQAYRTSFGGRELIPARDNAIKEIERASYYGGRSVARWIGAVRAVDPPKDEYFADPELNVEPRITGPVYLADMRQAYGWAMATEPLPVRYHRRIDDPPVCRLTRWLRNYGCIAVVRVCSNTESFPLRRFGVTSEPVGEYWTVLAGRELERAVRTDSVTRCGVALLYTLGRPLARFARHWMTLRENAEKIGDHASVTLCKMMVNSLHGRFAITTPTWVLDPKLPVEQDWGPYHVLDTTTRKTITARSFGSVAQRRDRWGEHPESWPAISAFLTAAVRERMLQLEDIAGPRQVLLIRTDALLLTERGYLALLHAGEIGETPGKLRLIVGPTSRCFVYSETNYVVANHVVRLGVSASANAVSSGVWVQDQYARTESSLAAGTTPAARLERVTVRLPATIPPASTLGDGWLPRPTVRSQAEEDPPLPSAMLGIRWSERHPSPPSQPDLFSGY